MTRHGESSDQAPRELMDLGKVEWFLNNIFSACYSRCIVGSVVKGLLTTSTRVLQSQMTIQKAGYRFVVGVTTDVMTFDQGCLFVGFVYMSGNVIPNLLYVRTM